jgi:hypothetical protein
MQMRTQVIVCSLVLIAAAGGALFMRKLMGLRVVCQAVTPDGIEMCIVQKLNYDPPFDLEPWFSTRFVYRKPGGAWKGFYYHHQDDFWGRSRVLLDTNAQRAIFYRTNGPAVTFDWATKTYIMHRWKRTNTEPEQMSGKWCPD